MYLRSIAPEAPRHEGLQATRIATERRPRPALREGGLGGDDAEQRRILQVLIEELGGEATAAALYVRLLEAGPAACNAAPDGAWLRSVLGDLDSRGAMTIEDMDGDEVIVRITKAGASLAYAGAAA